MIAAALVLTAVTGAFRSSGPESGVLRALVLCAPETRAQRLLEASSIDESLLNRLGLKRIAFGRDFIAVDERVWAPPELASRWALLRLMAKFDGRSIPISSLPEAIRDAALQRVNRNLRFVDSTANVTARDSMQLTWEVQVKVSTASGERSFTVAREPRRDFTPIPNLEAPEGIGEPGVARPRGEFGIHLLRGAEEPHFWEEVSKINDLVAAHRTAMDKALALAQASLMRKLFGDLPNLGGDGIPFASLPKDLQEQLRNSRYHLSDAELAASTVSGPKAASPMFVFTNGPNQTLVSPGALISPP